MKIINTNTHAIIKDKERMTANLTYEDIATIFFGEKVFFSGSGKLALTSNKNLNKTLTSDI
ncbi:MAG TPA: hypothetical protein VIK55_17650 [Paludibacter sp.]